MAISYVTSDTAQSDTITMPSGHQVGDLLVYVAGRANATAPTLPSGFTNWPTTSTGTATGHSVRLCYRIAASASEGAFQAVNASRVSVAVYRGASGPGAVAFSGNGSSTTVTLPALTLSVGTGSSWTGRVGSMPGNRDLTGLNPSTVPNTNRVRVNAATGGAVGVWDSNGGTGSNPTSGTFTVSTAGTSIGVTFELLAAPNTGGFFQFM